MADKPTAAEVERIFDEGGDVLQYADVSTFERPNQKQVQRRVSVDMPVTMIERLDRAAEKRGVNRQAVIKMWLWDKLDEEDAKAAHMA